MNHWAVECLRNGEVRPVLLEVSNQKPKNKEATYTRPDEGIGEVIEFSIVFSLVSRTVAPLHERISVKSKFPYKCSYVTSRRVWYRILIYNCYTRASSRVTMCKSTLEKDIVTTGLENSIVITEACWTLMMSSVVSGLVDWIFKQYAPLPQ